MERNPAARFQKRGPRHERGVQRDAEAMVEQQCEQYVREKMKPGLVAAGKRAIATFKSESWGSSKK